MVPVPFTEYSLKTNVGEVNSTEYSNEYLRTLLSINLQVSVNIFFWWKNNTYAENQALYAKEHDTEN